MGGGADHEEARRAYRKGRYADALALGAGLTAYETAVCEIAIGRAESAVQRLSSELEKDPDDADLLAALACATEKTGNVSDATKLYRRALLAAPAHGLANLNLGYLILIRGNIAGALACLQRSFDAAPAPTKEELAAPTFDAGALPCPSEDEARVRASAACLMLGIRLQEGARFEDAADCFEHALRLNPGNGAAYLALVSAGERDEDLVERMEAAYRIPGLRPSERGPLCFALARAKADAGDFGQAMRLYDEGNAIALSEAPTPFDREDFERSIDWMIRNYTADRLSRMAENGSPSEMPLPIVGMMRSGTTLVEQILTSHPDVAAGGELVFWRDNLSAHLRPGSPAPNSSQSASLIARYTELLRSLGSDAARVTDKMPQNFAVLGIMHALFPCARIVCCRRDAVDTCLSIYTTSFRNPMPFANAREDIAFFYRQFERLMTHWSEAIPRDRLMQIRYEDLLTDREATTRRLIEFCGLEWHEDCLHPERNRRAVKTASVWQVRQPVEAARRSRTAGFEPWLDEFRRLLL